MTAPLLSVEDLSVRFHTPEGSVHAVNGLSFHVNPGEWVGLLGESGSGKSVALTAILGLLPSHAEVSGTVSFQGTNLLTLSRRRMRTILGREIGVVFQSLASGLDPLIPVGEQVMEPMLAHALRTRPSARVRALELLAEVGLPDPEESFARFPFELSGGMRQRAMVAVALAGDPALLLADEPTTALDTTVQAGVLAALTEVSRRRGLSVVMVTHDVGVATNVLDRITVMYGGMVFEATDIDGFIQQARHPYTQALMRSMIDYRRREEPLTPIDGSAPVLRAPLRSCPFVDRCPVALPMCRQVRPEPVRVEEGHTVACHRVRQEVQNVG